MLYRLQTFSFTFMKIAFLGSGRMATALAEGFIRKKIATAQEIFASDINENARQVFAKKIGATIHENNEQLLQQAEVILLAVKPQHAKDLLLQLRSSFANKLLLSIAAGLSLSQLESWVDKTARIIRIMPNTPALVGASASAFALGKRATSTDAALIKTLFDAAGISLEKKEKYLDAVTGLSGSGPAYFFAAIEALVEGGVKEGLAPKLAQHLIVQTMLGAAKMILETGQSPTQLREAVTSPNGTTLEGLKVLDNYHVHEAYIAAVKAATQRSKDLSQSA